MEVIMKSNYYHDFIYDNSDWYFLMKTKDIARVSDSFSIGDFPNVLWTSYVESLKKYYEE